MLNTPQLPGKQMQLDAKISPSWVDGRLLRPWSFIRTLRIQLREMTGQLALIERQHVTRRNARACAMRVEAAALRRNIAEARVLIDRLQRRYLTGDERTPTYGLATRT
jgi:hypothetical protein